MLNCVQYNGVAEGVK